MSDRFKIAFEGLRCIEETDDSDTPSDEPYALFVVADIQSPIPKLEVFRTRQFGGVQQQQIREQHVPIWGLDGHPQVISDPEKVIVLVVLMENDESTPERVAAAARATMLATLATAVSAGKSRSDIIKELRSGLRLSADLGSSTGWGVVFPDDQVGPAQVLPIANADLKAARTRTHRLAPVICRYRKDADGDRDAGHYELHFSIAAAA